MKCRNCGLVNHADATHCSKCHTMLRKKEQNGSSGGGRALIQIVLLIAGVIAIVGLLWVIMHDLLHAV